MKYAVVARNYAEALLAVAVEAGAVERYGELLDAVAGVVASDPKVHGVLLSPRVTKAAKKQVLAKALRDVAPEPFIRFLGSIVQRGRQDILGPISAAYGELADVHFNRVHASVTLARTADAALQKLISDKVAALLGKEVVAHFNTDPALLGGVVVRVGDRSLDGSLRRRMQKLRAAMLGA